MRSLAVISRARGLAFPIFYSIASCGLPISWKIPEFSRSLGRARGSEISEIFDPAGVREDDQKSWRFWSRSSRPPCLRLIYLALVVREAARRSHSPIFGSSCIAKSLHISVCRSEGLSDLSVYESANRSINLSVWSSIFYWRICQFLILQIKRSLNDEQIIKSTI